MQPVAKLPNNPVTQFEPQFSKYLMKLQIERKNFTTINVISNLPAYAACLFQFRNELFDYPTLLQKIPRNGFLLSLVRLSDVVWRRCNDQIENFFLRQL